MSKQLDNRAYISKIDLLICKSLSQKGKKKKKAI
jgi:hypothetical protein